jgi:hypothetical protein
MEYEELEKALIRNESVMPDHYKEILLNAPLAYFGLI